MSYAILYTIIGLWSATLLFAILSCITCLLCCCPAKLNRCLGVLTLLLVITSTLVTAFFTHHLQALANGTYEAGVLAVRVAKVVL